MHHRATATSSAQLRHKLATPRFCSATNYSVHLLFSLRLLSSTTSSAWHKHLLLRALPPLRRIRFIADFSSDWQGRLILDFPDFRDHSLVLDAPAYIEVEPDVTHHLIVDRSVFPLWQSIDEISPRFAPLCRTSSRWSLADQHV